MGYDAEAPYSGTEYDLITGKMTVFTDGVRIKKTPKQDSRANQVYNELVAAAEALLMLVKGRKGRANKDNAKLTAQIRALIDKWR
jgi:metallo-beta-lactamase family protein